MTNQTQGPWHMTGSGYQNNKRMAIQIVHTPPDKRKPDQFICTVEGPIAISGEKIITPLANAQLIAAAPELLEACKAALFFCNQGHQDGPVIALQRAIAKASS